MSLFTLLSWNVNGVRAIYKKGFLSWLAQATPDILCLQETKAEESQLPVDLARPAGYHAFWNSAQRKGYSGTALLTREAPLSVQFGLGLEEFDQEGRTIIVEYPFFTLINCYFPNGGRDHSRVPFKLAFYAAFLDKCEQLRRRGQPVIFCGDVNTLDIKIWRQFVDQHPQSNIFHTPEMFQVFAQTKNYQPTLWAVVDNTDGHFPLVLMLPVEVKLMNGLLSKLTTRSILYGSVVCVPNPQGRQALVQHAKNPSVV